MLFLLSTFRKSIGNVVCNVGDNSCNNRCIASQLQLPFIGCASHYLQLEVQKLISEEEETIANVHKLMVKLPRPIVRAKLFLHTPLRVKLNIKTRWTSTYSMLSRHVELRIFVTEIDDKRLNDFVLNASSQLKVATLLKMLKQLNKVVLKLQHNDFKIRQRRVYLDSVLEVYSKLEVRLNVNARIVDFSHFESGIVKMQDRRKMNLISAEKSVLQKILLHRDSELQVEAEGETIIDRTMKTLKARGSENQSIYLDKRFLVPARIFARGYSWPLVIQ